MSSAAQAISEVLFVVGFYLALPAAIVWGWVRWWKRKHPQTRLSILSFVGFALATASALLAVCTVTYAQATSGFSYYDPLLLRIFRWGGLLSLSGTVFALIGAWRSGPLRWHALACAVGTLLFWFISAALE
jgi:hypothetical protein